MRCSNNYGFKWNLDLGFYAGPKFGWSDSRLELAQYIKERLDRDQRNVVLKLLFPYDRDIHTTT